MEYNIANKNGLIKHPSEEMNLKKFMVKWKNPVPWTHTHAMYSVILFRQNQNILFKDTYLEAINYKQERRGNQDSSEVLRVLPFII